MQCQNKLKKKRKVRAIRDFQSLELTDVITWRYSNSRQHHIGKLTEIF